MSGDVLRYFLNEDATQAGVKFGVPRGCDAGFDLPCVEDITISPQGFTLIKTGIHVAIPENWVGFVKDRSSVALRGGSITAGVIDAAYRGEVKVAMHNLGNEPLVFKQGDRIAQLVVISHLPGEQSFEASSLEDLGSTERGDGGFGSTGQ